MQHSFSAKCSTFARKKKKKFYILAIDLTKAFDKVFRPLPWLSMFKRGISAYIICVFMSYYENSLVLIELDGELSEIFVTLLGVKQGGPSSPTLFNFVPHQLILAIESLNWHSYW